MNAETQYLERSKDIGVARNNRARNVNFIILVWKYNIFCAQFYYVLYSRRFQCIDFLFDVHDRPYA